MKVNEFLVRCGSDPHKGGGRFIEDPARVENIVFQTRGAALDPFEQGLADAMTSVFGAGHVELGAVTDALNALGSRDLAGASWTEASLTQQLARSADKLFGLEEEAANV